MKAWDNDRHEAALRKREDKKLIREKRASYCEPANTASTVNTNEPLTLNTTSLLKGQLL